MDTGRDANDWLRDGDEFVIEPLSPRPNPDSGRDVADDASDDATGQKTSASRPTIYIRAGALHQLASEAERVLIADDAPLYVRGGQLVLPVVDEVEAARGLRTKAARLRAVSTDALLDWLSRVATWKRYDGRSDRWVATDPPYRIAATILARDGEWSFPPLAGVITTPTMRRDGSLLNEEGYDAATRLLLRQPPPLPAVAFKPTREDATEAFKVLDALLDDFPFVDAASRSVALSALITPVVRGALSVAPLHAMRAPAPGSGKSYLVDVASAISTGQRCPVIAAGKSEEELEKRLGAALLAGQPIVSIDNLNGELAGDALCQMVERPVVRIRPLGRSELVQIESRATVFATGNNLVLVGDMVRRVVLCSLDPNMERPELRRFSGDPLGAVLADRGRYIAAALTIVRAYVAAGCPDPCPPLASFEDWSRLVRSALVWLGCDDPVETMEAARDEDPEMAALAGLVSAWHDTIGVGVTLSAGEVVAKAEQREWTTSGEYSDSAKPGEYLHPELHEALRTVASDGRGISAVRLGTWLARRKGRIAGGFKFSAVADTHSKAKRWVLLAQQAGLSCGGCG